MKLAFGLRIPFWLKISGAFLVVIAVGVLMVNVIVTHVVTNQYARFMAAASLEQARAVAPLFVAYYAQNKGWTGIETTVLGGMGNAMNRAMGRMGSEMQNENNVTMSLAMIVPTLARDDLVLADKNGRVVLDVNRALLDQMLAPSYLSQGMPLVTSEGRHIGTLLSGSVLLRFPPPTRQFFRSLNRGILLAGLVAGLVALALGTLLVRQLMRPLRAVTQAAENIAAGKLKQTVSVPSYDEIGKLSVAFNVMSTRLQRAEALRQQMVADTAHELRTPIAIIQGDLEALLDGYSQPDEATFLSLYKEMQRLTRLVNDLHDLSLLEAGEINLELRATDMKVLLQQLAATFGPNTQAHNVVLKTLWEGGTGFVVYADADRVLQVLHNLTSNALRYTPPGGQITLALERQADYVACSVTDTGPGLSLEELTLVFERFWRADKARGRQGGGSGLGLSICKKLVETHGGQMTVSSTPGQGTCFNFTLPLALDA